MSQQTSRPGPRCQLLRRDVGPLRFNRRSYLQRGNEQFRDAPGRRHSSRRNPGSSQHNEHRTELARFRVLRQGRCAFFQAAAAQEVPVNLHEVCCSVSLPLSSIRKINRGKGKERGSERTSIIDNPPLFVNGAGKAGVVGLMKGMRKDHQWQGVQRCDLAAGEMLGGLRRWRGRARGVWLSPIIRCRAPWGSAPGRHGDRSARGSGSRW